jgi:hypothetical protein
MKKGYWTAGNVAAARDAQVLRERTKRSQTQAPAQGHAQVGGRISAAKRKENEHGRNNTQHQACRGRPGRVHARGAVAAGGGYRPHQRFSPGEVAGQDAWHGSGADASTVSVRFQLPDGRSGYRLNRPTEAHRIPDHEAGAGTMSWEGAVRPVLARIASRR